MSKLVVLGSESLKIVGPEPSLKLMGNVVQFTVSATLEEPTDWDNFAVGLFYYSGPMDQISINIGGNTYVVPKMNGVYASKAIPESGSVTAALEGSLGPLIPGLYVFQAVAGYVDSDTGVFYAVSFAPTAVYVPPPPPTVQATPTPATPTPVPTQTPSPLQKQLGAVTPWLLIVAAAGAGAAVGYLAGKKKE